MFVTVACVCARKDSKRLLQKCRLNTVWKEIWRIKSTPCRILLRQMWEWLYHHWWRGIHLITAPPKNYSTASWKNGFQYIRNGAETTRSTRKLQAPSTFDRFHLLGKSMKGELYIRLVGDFMVCGQLVNFCALSSNSRRKCFCCPCTRLDDVIAVCEDVRSETCRIIF